MSARHFYVWCPARGQSDADALAITAPGPREAACEWAQHDDATSVEYDIAKGNDVTLMVRDKDNRELSEWIVSGEAVPHYSARPAKDQR